MSAGPVKPGLAGGLIGVWSLALTLCLFGCVKTSCDYCLKGSNYGKVVRLGEKYSRW